MPTEDTVPRSSTQCATGQFCQWSTANYLGTVYTTTVSAKDTGMATARSVWNRTSKAVRVYSGVNYSGTSVCLKVGQQTPSTSLPAKSVKILSTATC
ncbi:MAG: peptidase inhibitor family I36 protein [Cellulomonadaceae bacterium]|nr:peptidase inhibitor family I36 protein [Cellulomonadaceae bacterium]